MFFGDLNYMVAIVAALVAMGSGFLWYSPFVFGKRFMKESGMTPESTEEYMKNGGKAKMTKMYAVTFVLAFVTALILSALFNSLIIVGFGGYLLAAFLVWFGFSLPVAANHVMFGKDSIALMAITSGYQLISLLITTLIVGIFG